MIRFRLALLWLAPEAACCLIFLVYFLVDRLPRFFQGDSLAYMTTGLSGWIPPDRSWAYGYLSRWLMELTHAVMPLVVLQILALLAAILFLCRAFPASPRGRFASLIFAILASADPLNQVFARFWLSDTVAAAAFLGFIGLTALSIAGVRRWIVAVLLFVSCLISIFIRVAYAPIEFLTIAIAFAATFRVQRGQAPGRVRTRLLLAGLAPLLCTGLFAVSNAYVAMPAVRGDVSLNHTSGLFTMGVFLPALRRADFLRAGVTMSEAEFTQLNLGDYDARGQQMWWDGPHYIRWLLQQKLGVTTNYDPRLQRVCAAVVRSALLHHPQSLALVYVRSLGLFFTPREWMNGFDAQMGLRRALPDWATRFLASETRHPVSADITAQITPLIRLLRAVIGGIPVLLVGGAAVSSVFLFIRRPFSIAQIAASGLLASLLVLPLYSHAIIPRYLVSAVTLCVFVFSMTICMERGDGV